MARPQPETPALRDLTTEQDAALRCLVHGEIEGQSLVASAWTDTVARAVSSVSYHRSGHVDEAGNQRSRDGLVRLVDATGEEDRAIDRIDARRMVDRCRKALEAMAPVDRKLVVSTYEAELLPLSVRKSVEALGSLAGAVMHTSTLRTVAGGKPGFDALRQLAQAEGEHGAAVRAQALAEAAALRRIAVDDFVTVWDQLYQSVASKHGEGG